VLALSFLSGTAGCQPRVEAPNLIIGSVVVGQGSAGVITVRNIGDGECTLNDAHEAPGLPFDVGFTFSVARIGTIQPGADDEEAIRLMNDSRYGLTASIWTLDLDAALRIGERVETGTWFMNRCDYLDPALAWTGVKDSGRGCTLSRLGLETFTRPKSFHLKLAP